MKAYRKKPVVIQALQWDGDNIAEITKFCSKCYSNPSTNDETQVLTVATLEGNMRATISDFIIKGVDGEFYPCKKSIFEKTYENVI